MQHRKAHSTLPAAGHAPAPMHAHTHSANAQNAPSTPPITGGAGGMLSPATAAAHARAAHRTVASIGHSTSADASAEHSSARLPIRSDASGWAAAAGETDERNQPIHERPSERALPVGSASREPAASDGLASGGETRAGGGGGGMPSGTRC